MTRMFADRPSRTAQHNALFRAIEQRLPAPLFADPFARHFLRGRYRLAALLPAAALARAIDARWPGPRAAVCVRTRWIDDAIAAELARGLDQLVMLGAGFDARAHRMPGIDRVRVFEVDHPATQEMKRRVVGVASPHVTYVPVDFLRDALPDALARAGLKQASRSPQGREAAAQRGEAERSVGPRKGWKPSEDHQEGARTLFLWEGVTNYLDEASVDATLRYIARAGSALLFTYVDRAVIDGLESFQGGPESVEYVKKLGEPFTFGLVPAELPAYLAARGIELEEDQPLSEAALRYYPEAGPPVSAYYHVVSARCRG
jgi:O-methyltransferase involved in polyketide biosynthesis